LKMMTTTNASKVFAAVDGRKNYHKHKLQRVKTIVDTNI